VLCTPVVAKPTVLATPKRVLHPMQDMALPALAA
jgi:hypothetical protein